MALNRTTICLCFFLVIACWSCDNSPNKARVPRYIGGAVDTPPNTRVVTIPESQITEIPPGCSDSIRRHAKKLGTCMLRNDFVCFAAYLPPQLLAQFGGGTKFIAEMEANAERMKKDGEEILSLDFTKPSKVVLHKGQLQAVVPHVQRVKNRAGTIVDLHSSIIAVSYDGGIRWFFVDASTMKDDPALLKLYMPDLDASLKLPKMKMEVIKQAEEPTL